MGVGGETAHDVVLSVADMFEGTRATEIGSLLSHERDGLPLVLVGADFLKAHRVLLSRSHQMMFFTYAGTGPVFGAAAWRDDIEAPTVSASGKDAASAH